MKKTAKIVPVLRYLHVTPNAGEYNCYPQYFEKQMAYLAKRGFTTLTAKQFEGFLRGEPVPYKSVLITFDGGYLDNYVFAYPILKKYQLHASIFISTSSIKSGERRANFSEGEILPYCPPHAECKQKINNAHPEAVMLNWDELRFMVEDGTMAVHSFLHTQTRWDQQLNEEGKNAMVKKELEQSKDVLLKEMGDVDQHLCWPNGYFDDDYLALAKEAGFAYFYTNDSKGFNTREVSHDYIYRFSPPRKSGKRFGWRLWLARHPKLGYFYYHYIFSHVDPAADTVASATHQTPKESKENLY